MHLPISLLLIKIRTCPFAAGCGLGLKAKTEPAMKKMQRGIQSIFAIEFMHFMIGGMLLDMRINSKHSIN